MVRRHLALVSAGAIAVVMFPAPSGWRGGARPKPSSSLPGIGKSVDVPLAFEANGGQAGPSFSFVAHSPGSSVSLGATEGVVTMGSGKAPGAFHMRLDGANAAVQLAGSDPLATRVNYYRGSDPAQWVTNVATFAKVGGHDVYPGVDVTYYGTSGQLEYDLSVAAGADWRVIHLSFPGAGHLALKGGDLMVSLPGGVVRQGAPHAYQDLAAGRMVVPSAFTLHGSEVGFRLGSYDRSRPVVIDPIVYSRFVGGSADEGARAIGVDAAGDVYVAGQTSSSNFATTANAAQKTSLGVDDAFVYELDPTGRTVYSTYLGGSSNDGAWGIAVDGSGHAYVTGITTSSDFPTTPGGYDATPRNFADGTTTASSTTFTSASANFRSTDFHRLITESNIPAGTTVASIDSPTQVQLSNPATASGSGVPFTLGAGHDCCDAFVTKLSPTGALSYSTYLGYSGGGARAIAIDAAGDAFVAGENDTQGGFPTVNAFQAAANPATGQANFVSELDPTGSVLLYSTYLGGNTFDEVGGIAVQNAANVYLSGDTASSDYPTTPGAFQPSNPDPATSHAILTKLDTTVSGAAQLKYSTYLGGAGNDHGNPSPNVAADASGHAWVTGTTTSPSFPTTPGAFNPTPNGNELVFVTKFNTLASGNASLLYSTYLGGAGISAVTDGIAVDSAGNAYVAGATASAVWPTSSPVEGRLRSAKQNMYLTKLNAAGNALVWSTYLGGTTQGPFPREGQNVAVAVDSQGNAYVAGTSNALDFPGAPGAPSPSSAGGTESTTTKFTAAPPARVSDFVGDGRTDLAVFRPSTSTWYRRGANPQVVTYGTTGDIAAPGDYDGDGKADVAVFRPSTGTWFVHQTTGGDTSTHFGGSGDIPVPADYFGTGRTDMAVFRPSTGIWYIHHPAGGADMVVSWGASGDIPVPGDYDGDGKVDVAVFRPSTSTWYVKKSGGGVTTLAYGTTGDIPVPGDYDGDSRTDIALFRPSSGTWFVHNSNGGDTATRLGASGDIPAPGDYDRDGRTDLAVFRPSSGTWYELLSTTGAVVATAYGTNGDLPGPLPSAIKGFFP